MDKPVKKFRQPQIYTGEITGRRKRTEGGRPAGQDPAGAGQTAPEEPQENLRQAGQPEEPQKSVQSKIQSMTGGKPSENVQKPVQNASQPEKLQEGLRQAGQPEKLQKSVQSRIQSMTGGKPSENVQKPVQNAGQPEEPQENLHQAGQPERPQENPSQNTEQPSGLGKQLRARVSERLNPVTKRKREQENLMKMQALGVALAVLIVLLIGALIYEVVLGHGTKQTGQERMEALREAKLQQEAGASQGQGGPDAAGTVTDGGAADPAQTALSGEELLEQAKFRAVQYDYDGAIGLLKSAEGYEENGQYRAAVDEFEQQKASCVPYAAADVTHIFFQTLIHDAGRAFDGDQYADSYNQNMVTEHEFNSIIQQMYDRGYVMVFLDEFAPETEDSDGNSTFGTRDILLPPGKIPFVLSQDDVNYYHSMEGNGFASRLIVDENGDVKNEYIEDDGSVSVGDYDLVPLIDRFVEQHPDFAYHGEKGYIALTGYEGILGYRTDEVYKTKEAGRVTDFQQRFFDSYPGGFDEAAFDRECEEAKKVAEAMKANGWRFASHTWGHQNMNETNGVNYDQFVRDTDRWTDWVEPLVGETNVLIYAAGGDIRGAESYSGDRFNYLKQSGFDYFCGVDSAKHWLQVGTDYVRQSRRDISGYRMYHNPELLSDLFDAAQAWDPLRPESVPQL